MPISEIRGLSGASSVDGGPFERQGGSRKGEVGLLPDPTWRIRRGWFSSETLDMGYVWPYPFSLPQPA